jgi:hypothetical protein
MGACISWAGHAALPAGLVTLACWRGWDTVVVGPKLLRACCGYNAAKGLHRRAPAPPVPHRLGSARLHLTGRRRPAQHAQPPTTGCLGQAPRTGR